MTYHEAAYLLAGLVVGIYAGRGYWTDRERRRIERRLLAVLRSREVHQ